jgi:hypothetical protein
MSTQADCAHCPGPGPGSCGPGTVTGTVFAPGPRVAAVRRPQRLDQRGHSGRHRRVPRHGRIQGGIPLCARAAPRSRPPYRYRRCRTRNTDLNTSRPFNATPRRPRRPLDRRRGRRRPLPWLLRAAPLATIGYTTAPAVPPRSESAARHGACRCQCSQTASGWHGTTRPRIRRPGRHQQRDPKPLHAPPLAWPAPYGARHPDLANARRGRDPEPSPSRPSDPRSGPGRRSRVHAVPLSLRDSEPFIAWTAHLS